MSHDETVRLKYVDENPAFSQLFQKQTKKEAEHMRQCVKQVCGDVRKALLKSISNHLSHIHPNQWKINDMRTC